jgi:spore germination protein KA
MPLSTQTPLHNRLDDNINAICEIFGHSGDLVVRRLDIPENPMGLLFIESLVERKIVDEFVVKPLLESGLRYPNQHQGGGVTVATGRFATLNTLEEAAERLLQGDTLILVDQQAWAYSAGTQGGEQRPISEPASESVVRGPKDSFTETIHINIGLVRKRLSTPQLRIVNLHIGNTTHTPVAIMYLQGIAREDIVAEVLNRLKRIKIDGILESQYIEEMIEDPHGYTPFPTIFSTERPDRVCAGLLEGRVAILTGGTPFALVVPSELPMFLYSNEDYYQRFDVATFLKTLRTVTFVLSFIMPGFYVMLLTFHQEMIPTMLLIALAGQREGVPFGIAIEVTIMELTFEILREAGIRLPKTIGIAVSIVGGLVLGQAAVSAGLIGPGTVITVSITAICSFSTPSYSVAIASRLIRFALLFLSAGLGAFGFFFGIIFLIIHLTRLRSFGVPYLSPLVPFHLRDWKDILVRFPWWAMTTRPEEVAANSARFRMRGKNKWSDDPEGSNST